MKLLSSYQLNVLYILLVHVSEKPFEIQWFACFGSGRKKCRFVSILRNCIRIELI